jgi:hypothetical protein
MNFVIPQIPWQRWKPRLLECLPGYSHKAFLADIIAGLTVGRSMSEEFDQLDDGPQWKVRWNMRTWLRRPFLLSMTTQSA